MCLSRHSADVVSLVHLPIVLESDDPKVLVVVDHLVLDEVPIAGLLQGFQPYCKTGEFIGGGAGIGEASDLLELLATVSFLAGQTSRAGLLTSVLVLPYRNPLITAKLLTTIDVLSNGRLVVGCGVGWMSEEFEAVGTPPYNERGAVANVAWVQAA